MEKSKLHESLLLAFITFVIIDLFFKRSFERISWVVEKKENCLRDVIRPLLRVLNKVESSREISIDEKDQVISLYEKIFPSPKENIVQDICSLKPGQALSQVSEACLQRVIHEVKLQKENSRASTLSYGGMFLDLPFADGVVANLAVTIHFFKYVFWFPLFFYIFFYKSFTCFWIALMLGSIFFPVISGFKSWKSRKDRMRKENLYSQY